MQYIFCSNTHTYFLSERHFYDFTSSGLSHNVESWARADNPYRVGKSNWALNAGLIEIDWEAMNIELSVINPKGEKVITNTLELSEVRFP